MKFLIEKRLNEMHETSNYKGYDLDRNLDRDWESETITNWITIYKNDKKIGEVKGMSAARNFVDKHIEQEQRLKRKRFNEFCIFLETLPSPIAVKLILSMEKIVQELNPSNAINIAISPLSDEKHYLFTDLDDDSIFGQVDYFDYREDILYNSELFDNEQAVSDIKKEIKQGNFNNFLNYFKQSYKEY